MIPAMVQRLRFSINVQRSFTEIYPNFSEGCVIMAEKRRCTIAGIIILQLELNAMSRFSQFPVVLEVENQ